MSEGIGWRELVFVWTSELLRRKNLSFVQEFKLKIIPRPCDPNSGFHYRIPFIFRKCPWPCWKEWFGGPQKQLRNWSCGRDRYFPLTFSCLISHLVSLMICRRWDSRVCRPFGSRAIPNFLFWTQSLENMPAPFHLNSCKGHKTYKNRKPKTYNTLSWEDRADRIIHKIFFLLILSACSLNSGFLGANSRDNRLFRVASGDSSFCLKRIIAELREWESWYLIKLRIPKLCPPYKSEIWMVGCIFFFCEVGRYSTVPSRQGTSMRNA